MEQVWANIPNKEPD